MHFADFEFRQCLKIISAKSRMIPIQVEYANQHTWVLSCLCAALTALAMTFVASATNKFWFVERMMKGVVGVKNIYKM